MGIFDNIAKNALGKIAKTVENSVVSNIEKKAVDATNKVFNPDRSANSSGNPAGSSPPPAASQSTVSQADYWDDPNMKESVDQIISRFDGIISTEFPDLEVKKEAAPESIGLAADSPCKPYSFALRRGGKTVAVIIVVGRNRYRNRACRNAKKAAENSKVPFFYFFQTFPNKREYLITRIKSVL